MLDAHQLNVFLVAAKMLNFTSAARHLHMSQPSVSLHVQSLEQHFGQSLFIRAGRTLQLTDAGEALIPLAQDMVNRSIRIEETIKSLQGKVYGHLAVSCSTTPGKYILPQLLARFHHQFPQVKISCHVFPQEQSLQSLEDGETHFALTSVPHTSAKHVEFSKFMTDQIVLIVPLDHSWATKGEIEPEDLYEANFIFREENSGTQVTVRNALADAGIDIDQLKTLLVLGSSEAIALAVKEGMGTGFVSSLVVSRLVNGQVAVIKIKAVDLTRDIYIGRLTNRLATKAQTAFWDFAISQREIIVQGLNTEQTNVV
jgi:DNA-binding transcriptional LysR family regulator